MRLKNIINKGVKVLGILSFTGVTNCINYESFPVSYGDYTGDGIEDVMVNDSKNKKYIIFIKQKDGSYEKADVRIQDGYPYYPTDKGYYDSHGHFFSNESTEKLNQRTKEIINNIDK